MLHRFRWSPCNRHIPKLPLCNLAPMTMKYSIQVETMIEEPRPQNFNIGKSFFSQFYLLSSYPNGESSVDSLSSAPNGRRHLKLARNPSLTHALSLF